MDSSKAPKTQPKIIRRVRLHKTKSLPRSNVGVSDDKRDHSLHDPLFQSVDDNWREKPNTQKPAVLTAVSFIDNIGEKKDSKIQRLAIAICVDYKQTRCEEDIKLKLLKMESAVFEDCHVLLENFVKNGNPYFESFCVQWKFMMFQHVYTVQSSTIEIIQTTNAIFHIAKRTVCGRNSIGDKVEDGVNNDERCLLRRIGGLYLMYSIYFKQPTKQYVKVQVSLQTWKELTDFVKSLPPLPNTDEVRYVFWKLYKSDAFRFTAVDYHLGLENLVEYDRIDDLENLNSEEYPLRLHLMYKLHEVSEIRDKLPELIKMEDQYNVLKRKIAKNHQISSQALPPTKIFYEIKSVFQTIQELITGPSSSTKNSSDCHSSRRELKRKAATFVEDKEETSSEDIRKKDERQKTEYKRTLRRMSCRSIFAEKLPQHVLNDLEKSSEEEQVDEEISDVDNEENEKDN
uniref:snRNA-activating protein complex subunit 1 n=1 Tax=Glossina brevipalpis TaxID=37001 RepID=A0A1A9W591_9MUSC